MNWFTGLDGYSAHPLPLRCFRQLTCTFRPALDEKSSGAVQSAHVEVVYYNRFPQLLELHGAEMFPSRRH